MQSRMFLRLAGRSVLFFSVSLLVAPRGLSAQTENLDPLDLPGAPHRHETIDVDARPIVSRLPVSMIQPRRLLLDPEGALIIADWGAGAVLKMTPDEKVTVLASGLDEPAGLARDALGNIYVCTHAGGMMAAGNVYRISPSGERLLYAAGFTGPTGLAFDPQGNLFVANYHDDSISMIAPTGEVSTFAENIPTPSALLFDSAGVLHVLSGAEGTLLRLSQSGSPGVMAKGLLVPSDVALDPQGHLIVANYGGTELSYVDDKGNVRPYGTVPKGTISLQFDPEGNVLLLNWDERFLLKVTTYLSIPCPHCEKRIPLRLLPKNRPKKPQHAKPPVI